VDRAAARRRTGFRARWLAGWLALLAGCAADAPSRPHLVLIVVDTLRADHLGVYGYARPTSPNIDRLAGRGVTFTNAVAPSSWTRPSVASLFTSRAPHEHGAASFDRGLSPDLPTLAELLGRAGYRTLGVSGNFVHVNETTGLSRGFEEFHAASVRLSSREGDVLFRVHPRGASEVLLRAPTGEELNREILARLPGAGEGPLFLYVHYMDPHAGYHPPEPFRSAFLPAGADAGSDATSDYVVELAARPTPPPAPELARLRALYDAEVAAADHAVGGLLETLEARGFGEDLVVVLASDHGEEFGEHGGLFHGVTLHRESLAVPLVVYDSRRLRRGERREDPVDLLDVAPTLLALAGIEPPEEMRGRPLLGAGPLPGRELVAELHSDPPFEEHLRPRSQRLALIRWPWKVIVARDGAALTYRLDRDPAETEPLSGEVAPGGLLRDARELARRSSASDRGQPLDLDLESLGRLRALGYAE
jgi:arylsulfatase A-like enzyme